VHLPFPNAEIVAEGLAAARAKREAELLTCSLCAERFVPGHMHLIDERNVCHGCAEKNLGIVH
jgi:formylmethanofuran dehydrogenase subunit E